MGHLLVVIPLQCIVVLFCDVTKDTWPAGVSHKQAFFSTVWSCQVHGLVTIYDCRLKRVSTSQPQHTVHLYIRSMRHRFGRKLKKVLSSLKTVFISQKTCLIVNWWLSAHCPKLFLFAWCLQSSQQRVNVFFNLNYPGGVPLLQSKQTPAGLRHRICRSCRTWLSDVTVESLCHTRPVHLSAIAQSLISWFSCVSLNLSSL